MSAEEFVREKLKSVNRYTGQALSLHTITGEEALRWIHEYKQQTTVQAGLSLDECVASIKVNRANFEHIASSGRISGTLFADLKSILVEYGHSTAAKWKHDYIDLQNKYIEVIQDKEVFYLKEIESLQSQLIEKENEIGKLLNRQKLIISEIEAELKAVEEYKKQIEKLQIDVINSRSKNGYLLSVINESRELLNNIQQ